MHLVVMAVERIVSVLSDDYFKTKECSLCEMLPALYLLLLVEVREHITEFTAAVSCQTVMLKLHKLQTC